jgi:hypothetical protein
MVRIASRRRTLKSNSEFSYKNIDNYIDLSISILYQWPLDVAMKSILLNLAKI